MSAARHFTNDADAIDPFDPCWVHVATAAGRALTRMASGATNPSENIDTADLDVIAMREIEGRRTDEADA